METGGGAEGAVEVEDVVEVPLLDGGGLVAARTAVAAALSVVDVGSGVLVDPLLLPLPDDELPPLLLDDDDELELPLLDDELPPPLLDDDELELPLLDDELPPLLLEDDEPDPPPLDDELLPLLLPPASRR